MCLTGSGRLVALQLDTGRIKWSRLLPLPGASYKLVTTRAHRLGTALPAEVALLFSSSESEVKVLYVDATDGSDSGGSSSSSSSKAASSFPIDASKPYSVVTMPLRLPASSDSAAAAAAGGASVAKGAGGGKDGADDEAAQATGSVMMVTGFHAASAGAPGPVACVMTGDAKFAAAALAGPSQSGKTFFHVLDEGAGTVESLLVDATPLKEAATAESDVNCYGSSAVGRAAYLEAVPGARTVSVAYPAASDVLNAPAQILGDDSLLLKYRNKHLVAVLSESPPPPPTAGADGADGADSADGAESAAAAAATAPAVSSGSGSGSGAAATSTVGPSVQVSLIDTVAGRILHRVTHSFAAASSSSPVLASSSSSSASAAFSTSSTSSSSAPTIVISENWVLYSYWNAKAKRTEIGVLALFEGMMGPYDLNPFKVRLVSSRLVSSRLV